MIRSRILSVIMLVAFMAMGLVRTASAQIPLYSEIHGRVQYVGRLYASHTILMGAKLQQLKKEDLEFYVKRDPKCDKDWGKTYGWPFSGRVECGTPAATRVPGVNVMWFVPQGVGALNQCNETFEFDGEKLPIDPKTGRPNYMIRSRIDAGYIFGEWRVNEGQVITINPDAYTSRVHYLHQEISWWNGKEWSRWTALIFFHGGGSNDLHTNDVDSLPICFKKPDEGWDLSKPENWGKVADWGDLEAGYAATGVKGTRIGGIINLIPEKLPAKKDPPKKQPIEKGKPDHSDNPDLLGGDPPPDQLNDQVPDPVEVRRGHMKDGLDVWVVVALVPCTVEAYYSDKTDAKPDVCADLIPEENGKPPSARSARSFLRDDEHKALTYKFTFKFKDKTVVVWERCDGTKFDKEKNQ